MTSPLWLDRQEYPFESHYFNTPAGAMHYADEGIGEPIVFGHGNPAWSFEFRHLIKEFSTTNRSCSLSDGTQYYSQHDIEYGYSNFHSISDHVHQNPQIKSLSLQAS